jgi:photosystem II stability/assembly factor-like uncharacterized protein
MLFSFCKSAKETVYESFSAIEMDTLLTDKISLRAIALSTDRVYYAGDKNRVGYVFLDKSQKFERIIKNDTLNFEFRSIALAGNSIFALNVGNPALLYKFSNRLIDKKLVYQENNEKIFYDSMQFWNEKEGIAFGDPTNGCLSLIITRDKGETWKKINCDGLPKFEEGEAGFAASNSNISIVGNKTWIVSGGKKARVFYSSDKGKNWKVYETPIVQGESMTGIFTSHFYNDKLGVIAGGNYDKPNQNFQNKALTTDGGKTWKLIAENSGFGYASCIQFFPKSGGNKLLCVGAKGIFYSQDKGKSWFQMSQDATFYTIRFIDERTAIAAGKNKIVRFKFKK